MKELTNARRRVSRNRAKAEAARGLGLDGAEQLKRVEADKAIVGALEETLAAAGHDTTPEPAPAPSAPVVDAAPAGQPAYYDPATSPEGPVTMNFLRRKGTSTAYGNFGSQFGQDVEPAGRYLTQGTMQPHLTESEWDHGVVTFENPLRLPFGDDDYTAPGNWKRKLSREYGGKTGKALSQAVRADGHDAIITWDKYGTSEIVDISSIKAAAAKKAPAKPKAAKAPRTGQDLASELKAEYPGLILHLESPSKGQGSPYVVLSHIEIPKTGRNSGAGTAIMERIIKEADANGWPLALTPDGAFGGSKTRLERFYRRFGFVPNKGRAKDYLTQEAMVRQPAK